MRRKSKRVTAGKRQTFEAHFLFNYILDVLENLDIRKKQEMKIRERGNYIVDEKSLVAMIL